MLWPGESGKGLDCEGGEEAERQGVVGEVAWWECWGGWT